MVPSSPSVRDDATTRGGEGEGEGRMILGSWSRQELTDYPGNGRGGGVMVSQGQIQLLTATFVKFCSCAPCRNMNTVEQKYEHRGAEIRTQCEAQTLALLLGYSLQLSGAVRVRAICRKG